MTLSWTTADFAILEVELLAFNSLHQLFRGVDIPPLRSCQRLTYQMNIPIIQAGQFLNSKTLEAPLCVACRRNIKTSGISHEAQLIVCLQSTCFLGKVGCIERSSAKLPNSKSDFLID